MRFSVTRQHVLIGKLIVVYRDRRRASDPRVDSARIVWHNDHEDGTTEELRHGGYAFRGPRFGRPEHAPVAGVSVGWRGARPVDPHRSRFTRKGRQFRRMLASPPSQLGAVKMGEEAAVGPRGQ